MWAVVLGAEISNKKLTTPILNLYLFLYVSGVHEDDGSQQLAALERLVPHVLPLPLHFSFFCHSAPLYPGEFAFQVAVT